MSGAEPEIDFHGPFRRFGRRARLGQGLGSSTGIRAWFGRLGVFVFSFLRGFKVVLDLVFGFRWSSVLPPRAGPESRRRRRK